MPTSDTQAHWERMHRERAPTDVSWFQTHPEVSLELIAATGIGPDAPLLDVGGGISNLVDALLDAGHTHLAVLDLSAAALEHTRHRLGPRASGVHWLVGDVLHAELGGPWAVWHDRAVFHFLTEPAQQQRYAERLHAHLAPGGQAIVGTFAADGPTRCSGLPVQRYGAEALGEVLRLEILEARLHVHTTPGGGEQRFQFVRGVPRS